MHRAFGTSGPVAAFGEDSSGERRGGQARRWARRRGPLFPPRRVRYLARGAFTKRGHKGGMREGLALRGSRMGRRSEQARTDNRLAQPTHLPRLSCDVLRHRLETRRSFHAFESHSPTNRNAFACCRERSDSYGFGCSGFGPQNISRSAPAWPPGFLGFGSYGMVGGVSNLFRTVAIRSFSFQGSSVLSSLKTSFSTRSSTSAIAESRRNGSALSASTRK